MNSPPHQPLVSVIVPVLNGAPFIERCVASLRVQDYPRVEVIVVDDGSTDGTPNLIKPPVRLLKTAGRLGAGAARNYGAQQAQGDVLMFTDADCIAPKTWVRRTIGVMEDRRVLCGGGGYCGPAREVFMEQFAFEELAWRRRHIGGYAQTLVSNNMFCDKQLFLEKGGFPTVYRAATCEDMEFSWAMSREHPLWWDVENGVYHDFTCTLSDYLRQQIRFARDSVFMLVTNTALIRGRTHHGRQLYLETLLMGLSGLFLALMQWKIALACWAGIGVLNAGFIGRLTRKRGMSFTGKAIGVVYLRDAAIIYGCVKGWIMLLLHKARKA